LPKGETYVTQEAPKGELGLYIVSDNTNNPYRVKIRSPDYYSLQGLNVIAHNHLLADLNIEYHKETHSNRILGIHIFPILVIFPLA